jgi:hypothetical protein
MFLSNISPWVVISYIVSVALAHVSTSQVCSPDAIPYPKLLGIQITSLSAYERHNYSVDLPLGGTLTGLNFCNVSVSYTHPGTNDAINVQVWLPLEEWNMRFQGTGGGGYATGDFRALAPPVAQGYVAVATDGGHAMNGLNPESWALASPGNVNQYLLLDFASVALNDMAVLGKAITEKYYGMAPKYSYWNGCSTGGRQGIMMAQRYSEQYDGILAAAPAINWPSFLVAEYWGQLVMNQIGVYPPQCELEAIAAAAIKACDCLDGIADGIIAAPGLCHFDPHTLVGQEFSCSGAMVNISSAAATIVQAFWEGPRTTKGAFLWYGLHPDTSFGGLLNTTCSANGTCYGTPFDIAYHWIRLFIEKDPTFNPANMSFEEFEVVFHQSNQQYQSILGTDDPDLSAFRDAGGKMITWHGLADALIPPNGTVQYYERVMAMDDGVQDYYRFFEAPGVGHCWGGIGPFPGDAFGSLIKWVEEGIAPETLVGTSSSVNGTVRHQPLCPYPLVSAYKGGDPSQASSFECAASFTAKAGIGTDLGNMEPIQMPMSGGESEILI